MTYLVDVNRKGAGNSVSLKIDGKAVGGSVVPVPADGRKDVKVEAVIG